MKVTFLSHSGYSVELEKHIFIFDYIGGDLKIPKDKKSFFIASHTHKDHFTSDIFNYQADHYILSDDIKTNPPKNTIFVKKDLSFNIDDVTFFTAGSTDEGISILVNAEDKNILHTGDLNFWIWPRYNEEDILNMKREFETEVNKFKKFDIDVVMMPVDPRLKEDYIKSCDYYIKTLKAKHYFPMHMWNEFSISKDLKNRYKHLKNSTIHTVEHDNQEFFID